ncbi:small vasohibin-binding protein-like [Octopus sinensis]|uniref:Small vasohibin-binding protein n=1 Tax=Octopus sinensis TaxID=2607531 RepID=A0A7E6FCF4_9MOLL|nr:small vasohibin-binding protein-like [Octopus sinensis]
MKHELRQQKLLQKQKDEEMKNKQRHEIYALNNVMKKLEHTHFKQFCDSVGIKHRDNTETNTATFNESILSQNLII